MQTTMRSSWRAWGPAVLSVIAGTTCAAPNAATTEPAAFGRPAYGALAEPEEPPTAKPVESLQVTFFSHAEKLVGNIYFRPPRNRLPLPPAIIVTGSLMTVKEQMASSYAPLLAEAGYAALVFDFRRFGESEGQPREVESPSLKAEDIKAAVAFLQTNAGIDGRRIGILAICASAGYAALAAKDEPGIKSIAMVAPWLHNKQIVRGMYGGEAGVRRRLEQARVAQQIYGEAGIVSYIQAANKTNADAAMYWTGDSLDYFLNPRRGAIRQWGARFAVMAWTEWLEFDPIALATQLDVPIRLVSGAQTATPEGAKEFAAGLKGAHDIVLLEGKQGDFYDNRRTVSSAAAAAIEHFRRTL